MSTNSPAKAETATQADLFAIRLFACLLIYGGVSSTIGMIYELANGRTGVDLGFLLIFLGKGLLQRNDAALIWATFIAWLGIVFAPIATGLILYFGEENPLLLMQIDTGASLSPYLLALGPVCWFAFSLWQRHVLSKERVSNEFALENRARNSWWVVIALLSLAVCSVDYTTQHFAKQLIDSIEQHEATIIIVDADTHEPLNPRWHIHSSSSPFADKPLLPRITQTTSTRQGGTIANDISWLSNGPISMEVSSKGYERKQVVLSEKDDGETIKVKLKKERTP